MESLNAMMPPPRFLLVCLLTLITSTGVIAQSSSNGIAAVVNGLVITRSEVREAVTAQEQMLRMQLQNDPAILQRELANLRATALDSLIDRELVLSEFKRMGASMKAQYIDDDVNSIIRESFKGNRDAFVKELAQNGMTLKKFRELREKMMIVSAMRGKQAAQQIPATPKEVESYYQKNIDKWREGGMIKISRIVIPKYSGDAGTSPEGQRKIAEELRRKIIGGADFAATAKAYSPDSFYADDWVARDQMKPSIASAAFSLKQGGVSSVLEEEGVYIIIACEAIKHGSAKSLNEVRSEIERSLSSEKYKGTLDQWMEGLRKRAVIKKFDK